MDNKFLTGETIPLLSLNNSNDETEKETIQKPILYRNNSKATLCMILMVAIFILTILFSNEHLPSKYDKIKKITRRNETKLNNLLYYDNYKSILVDCSVNSNQKCINDNDCRSKCIYINNGIYCDRLLNTCISTKIKNGGTDTDDDGDTGFNDDSSLENDKGKRDKLKSNNCEEKYGTISMLKRNALFTFKDSWECSNYFPYADDKNKNKSSFYNFVCDNSFHSLLTYSNNLLCRCTQLVIDNYKDDDGVIQTVTFNQSNNLKACVVNIDLYELL